MPIRVPTTVKLGERLTTVVGGSETKVPEKKPNKMEKTTSPALLFIAIQQNPSRAEMAAHGKSMLSGPVLSARKFGTIRPKNEAALRMISK